MSDRPAAQPEPGEPELVLAEGMRFEGLLVLPRAGRIEGRVSGEVLAGGRVEVGTSGIVEADLEAAAVCVEGRVEGNLRARRIELGPHSIVRGDLHASRLLIRDGARVDGRCHCGELPASAPSE